MNTNPTPLTEATQRPLLLRPEEEARLKGDFVAALAEAPLTAEAWLMTPEEDEAWKGGDTTLAPKARRQQLAVHLMRALAPVDDAEL